MLSDPKGSVGKGPAEHGFKRGRNIDFCQTGAAPETAVADNLHCIRKNNFLNLRMIFKAFLTNHSHRLTINRFGNLYDIGILARIFIQGYTVIFQGIKVIIFFRTLFLRYDYSDVIPQIL